MNSIKQNEGPQPERIVIQLVDKGGRGDIAVERIEPKLFAVWVQIEGGPGGGHFWEPMGQCDNLASAMISIADTIECNVENDFYDEQ